MRYKFWLSSYVNEVLTQWAVASGLSLNQTITSALKKGAEDPAVVKRALEIARTLV